MSASLFDPAVEEAWIEMTGRHLVALCKRSQQALETLDLDAKVTYDPSTGRLSLHTYLGTECDSDRLVRALEDLAREKEDGRLDGA